MSKPTQAHLERVVSKSDSMEARKNIISQMPYYMGAKLVEVRVDPNSVIYRWSVEDTEDEQICILSAYWGDSKKRILSGAEPLQGKELVNCAKGNAYTGLANTASLCGYGTDVEGFRENLKQALSDLGLELGKIKSLQKILPV